MSGTEAPVAPERATRVKEEASPAIPAVYAAGPVDYIEHRSQSNHEQDNWRHRFLGDLPIELLCPTCLNQGHKDIFAVMQTNRDAMERAQFFVGYFPGDVATFGTPIEVWHWASQQPAPDRAILIHPAHMGVFVEYLAAVHQLMVVRTFEEARQWLQRRLQPG